MVKEQLFVRKSVYLHFVKSVINLSFTMERIVYKELLDWMNSVERKPLVLNGARQVGKTYALKEFGKKEFVKMAYFSLDRDEKARRVFESMGSVSSLVMSLSALAEVDITPGNTLLVLDEIQECPKALESLKYFHEDLPELHVAVAGSLLGISLHGNTSFPVGKVDMIKMYPLCFEEFLEAMGKHQLVNLIHSGNDESVSALSSAFVEYLRMYYYVGGMPEVVKSFVETGELQRVRRIQHQILFDYQRDFSKHAPSSIVPRINMVWNSIPSQLSKENKKFIYGAVRKGARAADFELAIEWLVDAGMVYKVHRVNLPQMPLKFYEDPNVFKLYMLDVGLMGAMVDAPAEAVLVGNSIFKEYKGAFTELYVHNELEFHGICSYYYTQDNSTIEVDFMVQKSVSVVPVEVKAEVSVKSKSLKTFIAKHPDMKGVRISMQEKCDQDWMINLPLYNFCRNFADCIDFRI